MNIKELAEQAGMQSPDGFKLTVGHMAMFQLEKFAELVAAQVYEECADIARDVANATEPDDWALHKCNEIEHAILTRSKA